MPFCVALLDLAKSAFIRSFQRSRPLTSLSLAFLTLFALAAVPAVDELIRRAGLSGKSSPSFETSFFSGLKPFASPAADLHLSFSPLTPDALAGKVTLNVHSPGPVQQCLQSVRLFTVKRDDRRDPTMFPPFVECTVHPSFPICQHPVFAFQTIGSTPCSRPVPRSLGFGIVSIWPLRRQPPSYVAATEEDNEKM